VTNFARTPARAGHHPLRLTLALLASLAAFALSTATAGAVVTEVEGTPVGLQPRTTELHSPSVSGPTTGFSNEGGNAVVSGSEVFAVYWDPQVWFHHEWVAKIDTFLHDLGAASGQDGTIFSALSQYHGRANESASYQSVFKGSYSDTAPYPAGKCTDPEPMLRGQITCLTDAQLREQLQSFISTHGTPKGMHAIYYLLTPPGVTVCLDEAAGHCSDFALSAEEREKEERASVSYQGSFCSYHGDINPDKAAQGDGNTILYAAIPWVAGREGGPWSYLPGLSGQGQAYDCQDGGWNPEKGEENPEEPRELSEKELEELAKATKKQKEEAAKARTLEGPHIEEPNQEELGEEGDYAPGLSDVIVNQIAVEQANIVTDPLLASWQNKTTGEEATDECRNTFAATAEPSSLAGSVTAEPETEAGTLSNEVVNGDPYYVNNVVNVGRLHKSDCVGGYGLVPRFTSPNPVNAGELVDFDGMESSVSEFQASLFGPTGPPTTTYAQFSWNFGDGATATGYAPGAPICEAPWLSPCAASAFHSYTYGGTYTVSLTITDVGGNRATVSHEVTVAGPTPPAGPGTAGPGSTSPGTPRVTPVLPGAPVAKAAVASHSLRSAVRKGLAVSYSVNEQVAGRFEVLMAASLAKKLKIAGAPATGLPAGTPPQLVIARSVLVTTKGGRSTVHIRFSKKVAARLKRVRKANVMLRLVVRNAASSDPQTATVLSAVTLAG